MLNRSLIFLSLLFFSSVNIAQEREMKWTDSQYPDYIKKVTDFGERADWSHDGKRILFVERSFGDVYEYNLETGKYKPLTHHYYHGGYVRALYLSNGDILLSGPKDFPGENWKEARFRLSELWVLRKNLDSPPTRLGEFCWEGPAVSRTDLKISWAVHHGLYPEKIRHYQLWVGELDYSSGEPVIVNERVVLDNYSEKMVRDMVLEPQNFVPGNENLLTVQAYRKQCDVYGLNIQTGKIVNYSDDPDSYDEPEGIFPDGKYTLVESGRHNDLNTGAQIDLWKLKLDSNNPEWERITWFNEGQKYKAANPVVSDDGKFIAFQVSGTHEVAGIGHGIYILDLEKIAQTDSITDIEGNTYKIVKIGDQWWMAENLRVTQYANGDPIPLLTGNEEWENTSDGAFCYYDNNKENIEKYGNLYNWHTVNDERGICPEGWHVASDKEWRSMEIYLGMKDAEAGKMTAWRGTNEGDKLKDESYGGNNSSGFSVLGSGYRDPSGTYKALGSDSDFWTTSAYMNQDNKEGILRGFLYTETTIVRNFHVTGYGFCIRCIKNNSRKNSCQ